MRVAIPAGAAGRRRLLAIVVAVLAAGAAAVGIALAAHRSAQHPSAAPPSALPSAPAPSVAAPGSMSLPQPPSAAVRKAKEQEKARGSAVVDPAWVERTAARAGIPAPAMRAYATAQMRAPKGCKVDWTTLAGIGWVESQQGTIGHRTLGPDGRPSTPIIGPALDGHGDVARIRATAASEAATGDPTWDHAIGPMQFLTSTWRRWGTDGDGDGTADPEDVDDAAATAAAYLCGSGYDLTTGSGWAHGLWSYNGSATYIEDVYAAAATYADRTT